jgi:hypothetical protein
MRPIPPQGRLRLTIESDRGEVVTVREAKNIVLKSGAQLIAGLFTGSLATPVNKVRLGFGTEVVSASATALTAPEPPIAAASLEMALEPAHFTLDAAGDEFVTVRIAAPFEPAVDLTNVTEAGLFAGDVLYNQVVFEPVDMSRGQVVTLFWQVDFPFGR